MDCAAFTRWLDEGLPIAEAPAMEAHAATCARCAAALRAERALATALGPDAERAPERFAERVMERVARARVAALVGAESDPLPWWVRVVAEPAAALALALAALVWWQAPTLARAAAQALQALASPGATGLLRQIALPRLALDLSRLSNPYLLFGVMLALLPFAWWAGLAVYHWSGDPQRASRTLHAAAPVALHR
jgi:hypothetical protein